MDGLFSGKGIPSAFPRLAGYFAGIALVLIGGITGVFVWALWPLSDSRFDWKPYFEEALARDDCDSAARIAAYAALAYDARAADVVRMTNESDECPELSARFTPLIVRLVAERASADGARTGFERWKYEWRPGWPGRINALPYIFVREIPFAASESVRRRGAGIGVLIAPLEIVTHLRCDFAISVDPGSAYYEMRRLLVRNGQTQFELPDWKRRYERCILRR